MNKLYILTIAAFLAPTYPASANPVQDKDDIQIRREDVDINRDGIVSTEEAKSYIKNLENEYRDELERQKIKIKELENPEVVIKETANPTPIVSNNESPTADSKMTVKEKEPDKKIPPSIQKKYDKRLKEMKTLDANNDGKLQAEELGIKTEKTFGSADKNKDGILSPEEITESQKKIKEGSIENKNNESTANLHAMKAKADYKNADKNDDDKISKEEYDAYFGSRYQKFDQDGDGVISEKEYRTDLEKLPSSHRKKKKED